MKQSFLIRFHGSIELGLNENLRAAQTRIAQRTANTLLIAVGLGDIKKAETSTQSSGSRSHRFATRRNLPKTNAQRGHGISVIEAQGGLRL